jgi:hypothetical protein
MSEDTNLPPADPIALLGRVEAWLNHLPTMPDHERRVMYAEVASQAAPEWIGANEPPKEALRLLMAHVGLALLRAAETLEGDDHQDGPVFRTTIIRTSLTLRDGKPREPHKPPADQSE